MRTTEHTEQHLPRIARLLGSPTQVIRIFRPQRVKKGIVLDGEPDECVNRFISFLQEKQII
ncbi:MAG TPA: hypothetical protein EYP60_02100 [bacterium (Candidatus Stahlbacteria)]|nr:hypothetical protein [Candidatus Stahlbacteria bacterium]